MNGQGFCGSCGCEVSPNASYCDNSPNCAYDSGPRYDDVDPKESLRNAKIVELVKDIKALNISIKDITDKYKEFI